jgi:phosphotransferase system  glucose/maltose/N-acetylglucosamine-specific IIC component
MEYRDWRELMILKEIALLYKAIMTSARRLVLKASDSKKFVGFTLATIALFTGFITSAQWMVVAGIWMGIQGGIDYKKLMGIDPPTEEEDVAEE